MMTIELVNIDTIRENPDNPRIIRDHKFWQLVRSVKTFPQMLAIRPIVVDADGVVIGGNMRLRACREAGMNVVYIIRALDLTDDQKLEFSIKDNVSFGEWDWDALANSFDPSDLESMGVDVAGLFSDVKEEAIKEPENTVNEKTCPNCGHVLN